MSKQQIEIIVRIMDNMTTLIERLEERVTKLEQILDLVEKTLSLKN